MTDGIVTLGTGQALAAILIALVVAALLVAAAVTARNRAERAVAAADKARAAAAWSAHQRDRALDLAYHERFARTPAHPWHGPTPTPTATPAMYVAQRAHARAAAPTFRDAT